MLDQMDDLELAESFAVPLLKQRLRKFSQFMVLLALRILLALAPNPFRDLLRLQSPNSLLSSHFGTLIAVENFVD
jgi:hypothetical protein